MKTLNASPELVILAKAGIQLANAVGIVSSAYCRKGSQNSRAKSGYQLDSRLRGNDEELALNQSNLSLKLLSCHEFNLALIDLRRPALSFV